MSSLATPTFFVLTSDKGLLNRTCKFIKAEFGEIEFTSEWHLFDHTSYYKDEMGEPLYRCIISIKTLVPLHKTAYMKNLATSWENEFRKNGKRIINIDPGLLDYQKLILLSGKHGGHKFPLTENIYADLVLFHDKSWIPMPWSFPDFKSGTYNDDLSIIRKNYKRKMKELA